MLIRYAQRYQNISVVRMRDHADEALRVIQAHPESGANIGTALHFAARSRMILGDWAAAEPIYRQALVRLKGKPGGGGEQAVLNSLYLGDALWRLQRFDEAEQLFRASLVMARERGGERHRVTLFVSSWLGLFLVSSGRVDEGRALLDATLATTLAELGEQDTLETPNARSMSARGWLEQGQPARADALLSQVIASNSRHYANSVVLAANLRDQARAWAELGRHAAAQEQLRRALAMDRAAVGEGAEPIRFNDYHALLARSSLAQGDLRGAAAELALLAPAPASAHLPLPTFEVVGHLIRAGIAQAEQRHADAVHEAQSALVQVQGAPVRRYFPRLEAEAEQLLARLNVAPH